MSGEKIGSLTVIVMRLGEQEAALTRLSHLLLHRGAGCGGGEPSSWTRGGRRVKQVQAEWENSLEEKDVMIPAAPSLGLCWSLRSTGCVIEWGCLEVRGFSGGAALLRR